MSKETQPVLCGACNCAVESVANPKPHDQVTCPRCHRSDRFDKVMDSIREFAVYKTHQALSKSLSKSMGGGLLKVKVNQPAYQQFRWIVGNLDF